MSIRWITLLSLSLLASALLSSCAHITVPDTEVCAVAGLIDAGADCVHTIQSGRRSMSLEQLIVFLEAQPEYVDADGVWHPARGAALIMSADDWNKMKTTLEQACEKLGNQCTYEMRATYETIKNNVGSIQRIP